jgi:hypothetical protein
MTSYLLNFDEFFQDAKSDKIDRAWQNWNDYIHKEVLLFVQMKVEYCCSTLHPTPRPQVPSRRPRKQHFKCTFHFAAYVRRYVPVAMLPVGHILLKHGKSEVDHFLIGHSEKVRNVLGYDHPSTDTHRSFYSMNQRSLYRYGIRINWLFAFLCGSLNLEHSKKNSDIYDVY